MAFTITADSVPEFDMPFNPFDSAWGVYEWIEWHKAMKAKYGQSEANSRFSQAWFVDQSAFSTPYNFWKYNNEFVDYFKKQGIEVGHFLSNTLINTGEAVVNVSEGVASASKFTKVLIPVALIVGAAYAYNTFIK